MLSVKPDTTIKEYQNFVKEVYGKPNDLHYDISDMLSNVQRFSMRALKGIRKNDIEKTRTNILISLSWFMSSMNRLHIDLENVVWKRFPYLCSYCGSCPCSCEENKVGERQDLIADQLKRPFSLKQFQHMFEKIYSSEKRTREHAGVHLAEEIGEFSEALLAYRGEHKEEHLKKVSIEAADVFSCFLGVCNSLNINMAEELSKIFFENCHVCKKAPCECDFSFVVNYKS